MIIKLIVLAEIRMLQQKMNLRKGF